MPISYTAFLYISYDIWYILGCTMDSASMGYFGVVLRCTKNTIAPGVCFV